MTALVDEQYIRNMPIGVTHGTLPSSESISQLIEVASQFVEDYLDRRVAAVNVTERIVGTGRYVLMLEQYPVNSISSISEIGYSGTSRTFDPSELLIHRDSGLIEWINKNRYFRTDRIYEVTYNAGFTTVPWPIKHATALQVVELMQPMYSGLGDAPAMIPETSAQFIELLEKYRRKRIS